MRARYNHSNSQALPVQELAFCPPSQRFLTDSREYAVHAVSVFKGVAFFLVIDDLDTPVFYPQGFFNVTETSLQDDWICNAFADPNDVRVVLGPTFIAGNLVSYAAMVDQQWDAQQLLRARISTSPK